MKTDKQSNRIQLSAPAMCAITRTSTRRASNSLGAWLMAAFLAAGAALASAATINVPGDQPTIVDALGVANPSDEIVIQSGTYDEADLLYVWAPLTLRATNGLVTVHVPSNKSAVAQVPGGVTNVVFDGIKFERLSADNDWMRSVEITGAASFTNCTFTGPANGVGVILFSGGDATFDSCTFSNFISTASWAAAIFMQNQGSSFSDVIVRNSTFDTGCNAWIRAFDNTNSWPRVGELTLSNCTFKAARYNHGVKFRDGGATKMHYDPTKALLFQDCTFEGTTLEIAEFHYTSSTNKPLSLTFSRCEFKAYNSTRKMFWLDLPTPIVFEDCLFAGGQHQTIMTVWGGPPSVNFYHCTMINDGYAVGTPQSSFIYGWDGGRTFNIVNCLFRCTNNYTAAFVGDAGSSTNRNYAVSYSVIDHATPVGAKTQITAGTGYSNTSLAPAFVNEASRDYHLVNGSPWVNGGTDLGYLLDLDGNARNQGGTPDMGAFESSFAPVTPTVSVTTSLGNVVVTFTGVLQSADQVQGPFTDVPSAVSPQTVAPTGTNLFWRARSP